MGLGIAHDELLELSEVDRAKPIAVAAGGSTMGARAIPWLTDVPAVAASWVVTLEVAPIIQRREASAAATIDKNRLTSWHNIGDWPTYLYTI